MARNYTRTLRAARAAGRVIVCSVAPYEGRPVTYRPRGVSDPMPWTIGEIRYSGRECHIREDKPSPALALVQHVARRSGR